MTNDDIARLEALLEYPPTSEWLSLMSWCAIARNLLPDLLAEQRKLNVRAASAEARIAALMAPLDDAELAVAIERCNELQVEVNHTGSSGTDGYGQSLNTVLTALRSALAREKK